jgi:ribosomal protein L11 methyltransferase
MYRSITLHIAEDLAEEASAVLIEHGADGVQVEDSSITLMPGRPTLTAGEARLIGYFSPEGAGPGLALALADLADRSVELFEEALEDRDWNEVWKSHFAPIEISQRLWVCPSWRINDAPKSARILVLDPGMAFGTGTHATTSLCLEGVDRFLERRPGSTVLDVGTGSGILAIAAKLLGAGRVRATDVDETAVRVALENAALNHVELETDATPLGRIDGQFDLVVANIMAAPLMAMADELVARLAPGGELLLSGILDPQGAEVSGAFARLFPTPPELRSKDGWVLLRFQR